MVGFGATLNIPCKYTDVPPGFTVGGATYGEQKAAGFFPDSDAGEDRPGQQPINEMLVEGVQTITPEIASQAVRQMVVKALRDQDGNIVATWDEGRWWTPEESAEFLRLIVADLKQQKP